MDLNRFCPCFWRCYLGSAISKCYCKNWHFETPNLWCKNKEKVPKTSCFRYYLWLRKAIHDDLGCASYGVAAVETGGKQLFTEQLQLDGFESGSLQKRKEKSHPDWDDFSFLVAEAGLEPTTSGL